MELNSASEFHVGILEISDLEPEIFNFATLCGGKKLFSLARRLGLSTLVRERAKQTKIKTCNLNYLSYDRLAAK